MADQDELLQTYIARLETGTPLQEIMEQLPVNEQHLGELLTLVADIRAVPYPTPGLVTQRDAAVFQFIETYSRRQSAHMHERPLRRNPSRWTTMPRLAFSGIVMAILFLIAALWFNSLSNIAAPQATLSVAAITGQVEANDDTTWQPIVDGQEIAVGQQIRTGSGSTAILTFFEGSRLHLAPNSQLTITDLARTAQDGLRVSLSQQTGSTRHEVVPLQAADATYVVHTPVGQVNVRGTTFSVAVAADGHAFFAVEEGSIDVTAAGETVPVAAGHTTRITTHGHAPAAPVSHFRSQGQLLQKAGNAWQIDDMLVQVNEETILTDEFNIGDLLLISGRILPNGRWQADTVEPADSSSHLTAFTGRLQAVTTDLWLIGDVTVHVPAETSAPANLVIGDLLRVTYIRLSNGHRIAQRIDRLAAETGGGPADDLGRSDQPARPSLSFLPDELEDTGCRLQYSLSAVLENSGEPPRDSAAGVEIGYEIIAGAQFIDAVTITPSGWGTIAPQETVPFTVQVQLHNIWLDAPEDTEIKLRIFISAESNRPDHHVTRLTITLVQSCRRTDTSTVTATPRPSDTARPSPTARATTAVTPESRDCTGAAPHPEATRLAQTYSVPYSEIIGWFCDGFGFGEIDLAYSLSNQSETAVADIFAMRRNGLGWGEIMQRLGLVPAGGPPTGLPPSAVPPTGLPPTGVPPNPEPRPTEIDSGPPPSVTPGSPSATPRPTEEGDDGPGPPIVPPGPSMTPPTPPGPPDTPPGDDEP